MTRTFVSTASVAALLVLTSTVAFAAKNPKAFIKDAIQGDNSEIMLGQLAEQKGGSQKVRDFGNTLATDHGQAKQEAVPVAKSLGVAPPDQPMKAATKEKAKLEKLSGARFDREFAKYMIKDHEKDIREFRQEANAKKGQTSALARKQLPVLEKHLQMAQSAERSEAK